MRMECPEQLPRRYWMNFPRSLIPDNRFLKFDERFIRQEVEKTLIGVGFRCERQIRRFIYKSKDVKKILRVYNLTKMLLGLNGYSSEVISIVVQPSHLNCGKLLRFSSGRECPVCGSHNVEPAGKFDPETCAIKFEKEARN